MVAAEAEFAQNDNPVEVAAWGPNIMTLCSCVMAFFCSSVYLSERIKHCKTVMKRGDSVHSFCPSSHVLGARRLGQGGVKGPGWSDHDCASN